MQTKVCSICSAEKPVTDFPKLKAGKHGVAGRCKVCDKVRQKAWRAENREARLAYCKRWNAEHREQGRANREAWRKNNAEKAARAVTNWRRKNPDKVRAYAKKWQDDNPDKGVDYRVRNKERIALYVKQWRAENPDKVAEYLRNYRRRHPAKANAKDARRRAAEAAATPSWLTPEDLRAIEVEYELARWCTEVMGVLYVVDHYYPLRGKTVCGLHVPTNLRVITNSDNCKKLNFHPGGPP